MLFVPHADPKICLIFFAVMFLAGFVIGLFDYDKKKRKKEEEARCQAEKEETDRLSYVQPHNRKKKLKNLRIRDFLFIFAKRVILDCKL